MQVNTVACVRAEPSARVRPTELTLLVPKSHPNDWKTGSPEALLPTQSSHRLLLKMRAKLFSLGFPKG